MALLPVPSLNFHQAELLGRLNRLDDVAMVVVVRLSPISARKVALSEAKKKELLSIIEILLSPLTRFSASGAEAEGRDVLALAEAKESEAAQAVSVLR